MTQTVAALAVLGAGKTGLAIGYRVLTMSGAPYRAFTTSGVAETSVAGTYRVTNGVEVPDDGGYIVFGTAGTDLAEAPVEAVVGYKLAADGLDSISTAAPAGVASNFREMLVMLWRHGFRKVTMTSTQIKHYADDGNTVVTTQTVSDDGNVQTQGAAT